VDNIDLERLKIYQDSFKHMMTFCSGAILLFSAVTGVLISNPNRVWFLAASIVLLAMGALFSMFGLVRVPSYMHSSKDDSSVPTSVPTALLDWYLSISALAAYVGLALFAAFAVGNLDWT
jgi:archaellum biogenesis protein FlaJ (TadC family)